MKSQNEATTKTLSPIWMQSDSSIWMQSGSLLYRLTDGRHPQNREEVNITMFNGTRDLDVRTDAAKRLVPLLGLLDEKHEDALALIQNATATHTAFVKLQAQMELLTRTSQMALDALTRASHLALNALEQASNEPGSQAWEQTKEAKVALREVLVQNDETDATSLPAPK